jgi:DNA repair exonuclease SbcCD ATPase subunit
METNQSTAVQTLPNIVEIQKIIGDAPATLVANTTSRDRAVQAADEMIKAHTNVGMTPELDGRMALYIDKGKKTIKAINEKRKPFTQMMDELKKKFTECENDIKTKVDEVQKLRDDYATKLMKERQEQERQAALKAAKEKEKITLTQQIKDEIAKAFYAYVAKKKEGALNYFNEITLENFEEHSKALTDSGLSFTPSQLKELKIPTFDVSYHSDDEVAEILSSIVCDDSLYVHYNSEYGTAMSALKKDLIDRLPSKKKELEALAAANEEEKKRLEEEKEKREKEEKEKAAAEAAKQTQEALANNSAEAAQSEAATSMTSLFAAAAVPALAVKESVEIKINNNAAYALLFQYRFDRKGKTMDQDSIEKMTLGRIKKYCEDNIKYTGEFI